MSLRGRVSNATRLAELARPLLKDLMLSGGGPAHLAAEKGLPRLAPSTITSVEGLLQEGGRVRDGLAGIQQRAQVLLDDDLKTIA